MAKTVSLNEFTYSFLASWSGQLTALAQKPISLGMTVHTALLFLDAEMKNPLIQKALAEALEKAVSPQEFDKQWEEKYRQITQSNTS